MIEKETIAVRALLEAYDPDQLEEGYIKVSPLEDELQASGISKELSDFLRYLMVVDPEKRPGATDVLRSQEFQALQEKAAAKNA